MMNSPNFASRTPELPEADQAHIQQKSIANWSPARRDFMKVLGAGFGSLMLANLSGCGGGDAVAQGIPTSAENLRAQLLTNEGFWNAVRGRFVLNPQKVFMNVGSGGSMPQSVLTRFAAENQTYAVESQSGYGHFLEQRTAIARGTGTLAGHGYGVEPDELVISYNTSDGMSKVLSGIPWERGDVVITTNQEHPAGDVPLGLAVERFGVIVRRILLPVGEGNVMLADGSMAPHTAQLYHTLFRNEVLTAQGQGQRVRAIMWSSPTFVTGTMLPIDQIMRVCKEFNLISICDGAHLPGMMAYNYGDLGVDFMAGAGHKWQCGPGSTGILIVRNRARANAAASLPPFFPVVTNSANTTLQAGSRPFLTGSTTQTVPWTERGAYDIGHVLQSIGSMHVPLINAVTQACLDWDTIGRKDIETYILGLSDYAKARIAEIWGAEALYTPRDPALSSALTSFNPFFGLDDTRALVRRITATNATVAFPPTVALVGLLAERNLVVRFSIVPRLTAPNTTVIELPIRLSTHLWHSPSQVDAALALIRSTAIEIIAASTMALQNARPQMNHLRAGAL
jgi:isopenicillin-N epimerase